RAPGGGRGGLLCRVFCRSGSSRRRAGMRPAGLLPGPVPEFSGPGAGRRGPLGFHRPAAGPGGGGGAGAADPVKRKGDDGALEIDLVFKIAAIGIIVAVLNQLLIRSGREDQAMMTTLAGLVWSCPCWCSRSATCS